MNAAGPTSRQKLVDRYLRAGDIGTALLPIFPAVHIVSAVFGVSTETTIVIAIGYLVLLVGHLWVFAYLTLRRKTDEFTHAMWHSGTTTAFFFIVFWLLIGPVAESFIVGYQMAHDADRSLPEVLMVHAWALPLTLTAFFIGFHFKRFRGDF